MQLSKKALLNGQIKPKTLDFYDTALRFFRTEDGKITLRVLTDLSTTPQSETQGKNQSEQFFWTRFMGEILSHENKQSYLSDLDMLHIINSDIVLQDEVNDHTLSLNKTHITLQKSRGTLVGTLEGHLALPQATLPIITNFHYNHTNQTTRLLTRFQDLHLSKVTDLIPTPYIQDIEIKGSLNGVLFINLDEALSPTKIRLNAKGNNGAINAASTFGINTPYDDLDIQFNHNFITGESQLEKLALTIGNSAFNTHGTYKHIKQDNHYVIKLNGTAENIKIDDLKTLWPTKIGVKPRAWVVRNLSQGDITTANVALHAIHQHNQKQKLKINSLSGDIHFQDATVVYLKNFPAIKGVKGKAIYEKDALTVTTTGGSYQDIKVNDATVVISEITSKPAHINIDVNLKSSIKTVLQVIDNEPFKFPSKMNIPIKNITGQSDLNLKFNFPLIKNPLTPEFKFEVNGNISDLSWQSVALNQTLNNATATLHIDRNALSIKGNGTFDTHPISIDWQSDFSKTKPYKNLLKATATLQRETVLPLIPEEHVLLEGELPIDLTYTTYSNAKQTAVIHSNLTPLSFLIPVLDVQKPIGAKGHAHAELQFQNSQLLSIENITFVTPELGFKGRISLAQQKDGKLSWSQGQLTNVQFKRNYLDLDINRSDQDFTLKISGQTLDISTLLKQNNIAAPEGITQKPLPTNAPKIILSGAIDTLITNPEAPVTNAKIFLVRERNGLIDHFELDGTAGSGQIYLRYLPIETGRHRLRIEADDAGATLQSLNVTNSVRGGVLIINGGPLKDGAPRELEGQIQLSNFTLVNAPLLARILGSVSLNGLQALLSGDGISFRRMTSKFFWRESYNDKRLAERKFLRIKDGQTAGSSLGLTFDGTIDLLEQTTDNKGTIVPVSGLGKAVEGIPLIGDILTGGGGGVFAATYTIKGPLNNPTIIVNPLAALAPGILRKIFFEGN